jgi:hypothetical protein
MKLGSFLGAALIISLVVYFAIHFTSASGGHHAPRMSGASARLPCLANNHCPMGQACSSGFCSEGFMAPVMPMQDMSSCNTQECKNRINSTCSRKDAPCPEGTFCQNDACVSISAQDQGEAYRQIGMLLD